MGAARTQPTAIAPILNAIQTLELVDRTRILKNLVHLDSDYLKLRWCYPDVLYFKFMVDLDELVARLKPVASTDINHQLNVESPQMRLYKDLHGALKTYKNSTFGRDNWIILQSSWTKTINEVRGTAAIQGLPGVISVLKTLLLILSVIGIVYLSYQARKNTMQNRSAFFPSTKESVVNTLQDLLSTMPILEKKPGQSTVELTSDAPAPGFLV